MHKKDQHINTGHRWETNKNKRRNNKGGRKTGKKTFFYIFSGVFHQCFSVVFLLFFISGNVFFSGSLFPQFDSVCILKLRMVLQQIGPGFSSRCSAWSCNMPMSRTCFSWSLGHSFNGGKLCSIWKSQLGPVWLSAEGLQTDFFFFKLAFHQSVEKANRYSRKWTGLPFLMVKKSWVKQTSLWDTLSKL